MEWLKIFTVIIGYLFTWHLTTYLINRVVGVQKSVSIFTPDNPLPSLNQQTIESISHANQNDKTIRDGYLIGKCENTIIFAMVLADAFTGLALVFAAKNLVRKEEIQQNSSFFLVGTMLNFTVTLVIAFIVKYLLELMS